MTLLDKKIIEYLTGMLYWHGDFHNWEDFTYWEDQGYLDSALLTNYFNFGINPCREPF
jgi:hypothetical protein